MPSQLSIITPCLNAQATIRETIESVLGQGIDDIQYIVIDGGSTDDTLEIINEYAKFIDIIVSEPDRGISDAFNKGIALATGEYIGIINADDYYEPKALEAALETILDHGEPDVIHGSLRYIPSQGQSYLEHPNIQNIWHFMSVFHPTMFIHRKAYKAIGQYRTDFHYAMDSEWVHRALANSLAFAQSPKVISNMRLGGKSHKYMCQSLLEFRRSAITHGANPLSTSYYFTRQLIIQTLININWIKQLRLKRKLK